MEIPGIERPNKRGSTAVERCIVKERWNTSSLWLNRTNRQDSKMRVQSRQARTEIEQNRINLNEGGYLNHEIKHREIPEIIYGPRSVPSYLISSILPKLKPDPHKCTFTRNSKKSQTLRNKKGELKSSEFRLGTVLLLGTYVSETRGASEDPVM